MRNYRRWMLLAAAAIGATLSAPASAQCRTGHERMRAIMNHADSYQVMVLAHRGYWGHYDHRHRNLPENSSGAIEAANNACADGVEIDVKTSRDGQLIVMHDFNLGRTTDVFAKDDHQKYNPFNNTGHNPPVDSWNAADITGLHLLTPDRSRNSIYHVPTVRHILNMWHRAWNVPLVFDVKTADAVRRLDDMAVEVMWNPGELIAVKVNATLYPNPAAYRHDAQALPAIPVFTTNMLGKIDVSTSLQEWGREARTIEINVKQHNGLLSVHKNIASTLLGSRVGVFQAIPDAGHGNFFKNTGECCYRLRDLFYTYHQGGNVLGRDTADNRGDLNFIASEGFGLVTTDDPNAAMKFFAARGRRASYAKSMQ